MLFFPRRGAAELSQRETDAATARDHSSPTAATEVTALASRIPMNKSLTSNMGVAPVSMPTTYDWRPSVFRLFASLSVSLRKRCHRVLGRIVLVGALALVATEASATGTNVLVNGDFESCNPSPTTFANNFVAPGVILPWVLGTGDQANVVTVLASGSYHYMAGPWRDASGVTGTGQRHYLDIKNGHNDFYQSFTPPCDGTVDFGGWFSSRSDNSGAAYAGTGSVRIVHGVGTSGTLVGTTITVNLPAGGNAHTDPWKATPPATVNVVGGQTYSYVVTMDDNVNFDEAYVTYKIECGASPTPSPTATVTPSPTVRPSPSPTATATATPVSTPCAQVMGEARCLPGGGYSYSFSAVNNGGADVTQILLTPGPGSTFTLSPQLVNLSTPLHNGQSTTQSVNLSNVKPGDKVCFFVTLMSDKTACCTVQVCPTLPVCGIR